MDTDTLHWLHKWSGIFIGLVLSAQLAGMAFGRFNSLLFAVTAMAVVLWIMEVVIRLLTGQAL